MDGPASGKPQPFSEKSFYVQEFRGRTLALCAPDAAAVAALAPVVADLGANGIRSLVLAPAELDLGGLPRVDAGADRLEGEVWRGLREGHALGIALSGGGFGAGCRSVATRLGVAKLVFLHAAGGLTRPDGRRISFVNLAELEPLARDAEQPHRQLMVEIRAALEAGISAVNLCTAEGLADELFTYAGSGTLFTRERYLAVRRLTLDDYDAAHHLMDRGVEEGYLAPRSEREREQVLAGGFGAFVEGRHLAGIGALILHPDGRSGEIASLYTLTRFLGEGVGAELVSHALAQAVALGLERVFACTTQERVGAFFERLGFKPVDAGELPAARWDGYDPGRRARVRCYQSRVASPSARSAE
jgi:N-acetylglutamate synthase-like GNAT family acetyltransferase